MFFLAPFAPLAVKVTMLSVAKIAGPVLLGASTAYTVEYAKSKAKNKATKENHQEVYRYEYQKHRAKYDAEMDSKNKKSV